MMHTMRPLPFVLASSNHGPMIVNRNDYQRAADGTAFGIGHQMLNHASVVVEEMQVFADMLAAHRQHYGNGGVVIDAGANIGVYTLDFARIMHGWGHVYAYEAQEKLFYALAGNVILNNFLNVTARWNALGKEVGEIAIPEPDYTQPASFASFELQAMPSNNFIGQAIDYNKPTARVPMITIDSQNFKRVDLLKIDVEGMELDVLEGARETIKRCKPIIFIEVIKSDEEKIRSILESNDYQLIAAGMNLFGVHKKDPIAAMIK